MEKILPFNQNSQEEIPKIIKVGFSEIKKEYDLKIEKISNFDYPENIQKETGILGYERTIITNESIIDLYKKIYKDIGIEIPDTIKTREDLLKVKDLLDDLRYDIDNEFEKAKVNRILKNLQKIGFSEKIKDYVLKLKDQNTFFPDDEEMGYYILMSLSGNEYPQSCFMHTMGYYASDKHKKEYLKKFVDDKFFLQKIYDSETIEELNKKRMSKIEDGTDHRTFQHSPIGFENHQTTFSVFDKKTNKFLKTINPSEIPKYQEKIDTDDVYLVTTSRGLNVVSQAGKESGRFSSNSVLDPAPKFGFEVDPYFEAYLKEVVNRFREINKINSKDSKHPFIDKSFAKIFKMLNYKNEVSDYLKTGKMRGTYGQNPGVEYENDDYESFAKYYNELFIKYGGYFEENMGENEEPGTGGLYTNKEIDIPILIGDNKIPQLRWGSAKYACLTTEKGFSFFKIKHIDSLPKKAK